jgi:hypothetical protein
MGISLFGKSESKDNQQRFEPPNPNPKLWRFLDGEDFGSWCLIAAYYPGCTTYGGIKLLVCRGSLESVRSLRILDPHLLDDGRVIARFTPDALGTKCARLVCDSLRSDLV